MLELLAIQEQKLDGFKYAAELLILLVAHTKKGRVV